MKMCTICGLAPSDDGLAKRYRVRWCVSCSKERWQGYQKKYEESDRGQARRQQGKEKERQERRDAVRPCRHCGKEIPAFSSGPNGAPRFYCGRQCKEAEKKMRPLRMRTQSWEDRNRTNAAERNRHQRAKAKAYDILMTDVALEVAWWQGVLAGKPTPPPQASLESSVA